MRPVLLEHGHGDDKGVMNGFTDNYIKVAVAAAPELDNRIVDVRLDSPADDGESIRATIVGIH